MPRPAADPSRSVVITLRVMKPITQSVMTTLLLERLLHPGHLERDAIEALVHGDVEHRALVADSKGHIGGDAFRLLGARLGPPGRNKSNFLAFGIEHQDAG